MRLLIDFKDCCEADNRIPESDRWLAWFDGMPGMVVAEATRQEAFDQLMISLRVKILYDNNNIAFDLK